MPPKTFKDKDAAAPESAEPEDATSVDANVAAALATVEEVVIAEGEPKKWKKQWGIEGLMESLEAALAEVAAADGTDLTELCKKVQQKITKASSKYAKDERAYLRTTDTLAKVLVEEFVDAAMGAISASLYDKDWFTKVDWSGPLTTASAYTFQGAKAFQRTLGPSIDQHIADGIFRYQEEERINKVMWTALETSGVNETHMKKANQHLLKAYDEAFVKAPYGSHDGVAASPELALLQDFVKGWMSEFVSRAWMPVLEDGIGASSGTKDAQVLFITVLFQYLTGPEIACIPSGILSRLGSLPAAPWNFIGECAEQVFTELEESGGAAGNNKLSMLMKRKASGEGATEGATKKLRIVGMA